MKKNKVGLEIIINIRANLEVIHTAYVIKIQYTQRDSCDFLQWIELQLSFITKESVKGFEGEFNCLGKIPEKYKTFSVRITKEVERTDKN